MKTKVAEVSDLTEGKGLCVKTGDVSLVLVKRGGKVHALENHCPHLGLPLGRGKIEDDEIVCPFHGSRFNICTGENTDWIAGVLGMKIPAWSRALLSFGKKPQPLRVFPATVEGQEVFVEI
jgi:nitrite reductase/ring-hydroxylating ferredoxin subunit